MVKKVIFIGGIAIDGIPRGGELMKNKLLLERLADFSIYPKIVNTHYWRKKPWCLVEIVWSLLTTGKNSTVILSASHASGKLIKILPLFTDPNNVIYWSVGGDLDKRIEKKEFSVNSLNKLKKVIVQGKKQALVLTSLGLNNVISIPNSKPIPSIPFTHERSFKGRFVYVSRIHPQKGVREIVEASNIIERENPQTVFSVDFYGVIDDSFKTEFNSLITGSEKCHYKGYLDLTSKNGYLKLSEYDCFLFPTYWPGEGFPGAVIDAYIAGLPLIATRWNLNEEMISDNKTGFLIPVKDARCLSDKMKQLFNCSSQFFQMRSCCREEALKYDVKEVLSEQLFSELGII